MFSSPEVDLNHMELGDNGGFPVPVAGEAIRLVRCEHEACGAATRVRLPIQLPAKAVRRVVCDGCHQPFECDYAVDDGVVGPGVHAPGLPLPHTQASARLLSPEGRAWPYLSIPVAAAAVIAALVLIQS
jgi:hypothetical protein